MNGAAPFRASQAPSRPRLTFWQRAWRGGRWVRWENPAWISCMPASSWWRGNDPRRSGRALAIEQHPDWEVLGHA